MKSNPIQDLITACRGISSAFKEGSKEPSEKEYEAFNGAISDFTKLADGIKGTVQKIKDLDGDLRKEQLVELAGYVNFLEADQMAFLENQRIMNGIVAEMKEVAILPSEVPKEVNALERVEFPDEGGVHTYMENQKYPYKGFPFLEFVDKIDYVKKISRGILSALYHMIQTHEVLYIGDEYKKNGKITTLRFAGWFATKFGITGRWLTRMMRAEIYTFARFIDRFKMKPIRYCDAVREVHRAYSVNYAGESEQAKQLRLMLRDLFCMYLESDNAYRYRFQDVFAEVNKKAIEKNPVKEFHRLYDIMIGREVKQEVKDTWALVKWLIDNYMTKDKEMRNLMKNVSLQMDVDKIRLDEMDKSYCRPRVDYHFGFVKEEKINVSNKLLSK